MGIVDIPRVGPMIGARKWGVYHGRVMSGTGTAAAGFAPMFEEWATGKGIRLESGTFNLCADRFVMIAHGQEHELLNGKRAPRGQDAPGFAPRLYQITVADSIRAWLFRWSEPPHLGQFVGSQHGCPDPHRFMEIVSEVRLRDELGVQDGDEVRVWFGWESSPAREAAERLEG